MSLKCIWGVCVAVIGIQLTQCAKLRIICKKDCSLKTYEEVDLSEAEKLLNYTECYNSSLKNFFWIFGVGGSLDGNASTNVTNAMCIYKSDDYNIFMVNWEKEAANGPSTGTVLDSITNAVAYFGSAIWKALYVVGPALGKALCRMAKLGFSLADTHLMGHSLGAHLAGAAANEANKTCAIPVGWVIGMDSAGPGFDQGLYSSRSLKSSDAKFVICFHTDNGGYGTNVTNKCHVDVNVNNKAFTETDVRKRVQPGCPERSLVQSSADDSCSHDRVWKYFVDSLKYHNLIASKAPGGVFSWLRGEGNCSDTVSFGLSWDTSKRGLYFMNTSSSSPFGLGAAGACPSS